MDAAIVREESVSGTERIAAAAGAAAILVGSAAVWYFDPLKESFFPVCPLYRFTGYACPGCGLTRAFHAMFHGDILAAMDFNALVPVFAVLLGIFFVSLVLYAIRGRGLGIDVFKPYALWTFLIILILFGVLRNLPIYPFNILFP